MTQPNASPTTPEHHYQPCPAGIVAIVLLVATIVVMFFGHLAYAFERQASERGVERSSAARQKNRSETATQHAAGESTRVTEPSPETPQPIAPEAPAARLNSKQLAKCEEQQDAHKATLNEITSRGQSQLQMLNTISERAQSFYREQGYQVSTYPTILKETEERRLAVEAAVKHTTDLAQTWTCDGDPFASITAVKDAKRAELHTLKDYKTSINNLISVVKSAAIQQEQREGSL